MSGLACRQVFGASAALAQQLHARDFLLRRLTVLPLVGAMLLLGCSGSDEQAQPQPPAALPNTEQVPPATQEQFATTAQSLPQPQATAVPAPSAVVPAPTNGPPPRLLGAAASGQKLANSAGLGQPLPSFLRRTVATGLSAPTDLVFANDGTLFYTLRHKGLFALRPGAAQEVPVFVPPGLDGSDSTGLLAVTLDPEFARDRFAYLFLRSISGGAADGRVVRVTVNASSTQASHRRDLVVVPGGTPADVSRANEVHTDGALRFGPDGFLYVGVGDGRSATAPQSGAVLAGKLLRIDREGQPAAGNAAPANFDPRVFAYGLREPMALASHPNTEAVLIAQRRGEQPDDIAIAKTGANGAWDPRCAPPKVGYCDRAADQGRSALVSGLVPAWRGGKAGEGITAIERLRDPVWGEWRNAFVVAFDGAQRLDLVKLAADGRTLNATPVLEKLGVGFKAVAQGPDGLYVMTSGKPGGDEIWRLTPQ
jgi:aldose sugar dehydrogenase